MNFTFPSLLFFILFHCFASLAIYTSLMDCMTFSKTSPLHLPSLDNTNYPALGHYLVDRGLSNAITILDPHFHHLHHAA